MSRIAVDCRDFCPAIDRKGEALGKRARQILRFARKFPWDVRGADGCWAVDVDSTCTRLFCGGQWQVDSVISFLNPT